MSANETDTASGKAGTLQTLSRAGFRVPDFSVIPADDEVAVEDTVAELASQFGFPLAVRSSASAEDGNVHSFAGQFESFLNLTDVQQLEDAVRRCRASLRSAAVQKYCETKGILCHQLRMDVIVQRMVQPTLSGVAFTVNPVTGSEAVVIEAVEGLGDNLLSGRSAALAAESPLVQRYQDQIVEAAICVAQHFGCPQDVEFAVAGGVVWILQSRPVTRIDTTGIPGEWTNTNFREGGVSSTVCSPLMWSLYSRIWDSTLKNALRQIKLFSGDFESARLVFGRPYWNLGALKQCLTRVPGFVEREFDTDLGIEIHYEGDGVRTPVNLKTLCQFLPTVFAIRRFVTQQTLSAKDFLNGGYEQIHKKYESIRNPDAALRPLVERDYLHFESNYFRTIFALSFAKLEFRHLFPGTDFSALMLDLPDVRHTAPMRRIRQMVQQGQVDITALQSEFGYHYHAGLDIRHPRWDEDPDYLERLACSPASNACESSDRFRDALARALSCLPVWKRWFFRTRLDRLRTLVWLREEMRDCSNRMYHLIRKHVLAISSLRNIGDDIFFMTYQEVLSDDRSRIDERRSVFNHFRNITPPNEVGNSVVPRPAADDANRSDVTLRGLSACPGTVRGTARVVQTACAAMQLPADVILVCPHTDPGWTPALSRAAGVITESGGILSHAAVICREFLLPAVLSVPHACTKIPDGCPVEIDGGSGVVRLTG